MGIVIYKTVCDEGTSISTSIRIPHLTLLNLLDLASPSRVGLEQRKTIETLANAQNISLIRKEVTHLAPKHHPNSLF